MPVYPYTAEPDITWFTFTDFAINQANRLVRGCNFPATTLSVPQQDPEDIQEGPLCFTECLMPTGRRCTYICPLCRGVSAYVVEPPRGFKKIKIPIDPFGEPMDTNPVVVCIGCNVRCAFIDLHGVYLCINSKTALVVCPTCDHITPLLGPATSTICQLCSKVQLDARACYFDNKRIKGDVHAQLSIDTTSRILESLDACEYHYSTIIIKDRVQPRPVYASKIRRKLQSQSSRRAAARE